MRILGHDNGSDCAAIEKQYRTVTRLNGMSAIFSSLAFAVVLGRSESVELGFNRVAGEKIEFVTSIEVEYQRTKMNLKGKSREEVKSVDTNRLVVETRRYDFGDQEVKQPDSVTERTMDADGRLIELKGDAVDTGTYRRQLLTTLCLPKRKYNVGEKWTYDEKANNKWNTPAIHVEFSLVGVESTGVHISSVGMERGIKNPMKLKSDYWIEPKTGAVVRQLYTIQNVPFNDKFTNATIELKRAQSGVHSLVSVDDVNSNLCCK